jgi:chromosome segregation ATPase
MKNRVGIILLAVICIALGIAFLVRNKTAVEQKRADTAAIFDLSNKWVDISGNLDEQRQVNIQLTNNLDASKKQLAALTNKLTEVSVTLDKTSATLAQTEASLAQTAATLKATQDEVAKRDTKIADLETQNLAYDKQAVELSAALTNLNTQIFDTERKLAASEGDKAFLEKELKRLMGEKAELERQFNDLQVLRVQVRQLKEELSVARRLDWIRKGLFASDEQKGAQKLMQGITSPSAKSNLSAHYDLNVEVSADGSVRVIPPLTNRPPQ